MSFRNRFFAVAGTVFLAATAGALVLVRNLLEGVSRAGAAQELDAALEAARLAADLALVGLAGLLVAVLLLWLGSRRFQRSLSDLTEVMAETGANGRLTQPKARGPGGPWVGTEVDELRSAFARLMKTVDESFRDRERSYVEAVGAVVAAIDARDHETTGHSFRVAHYALALARALEMGPDQIRAIEWGALLHDVGKIAVPDAILRKSGRLTEEEWHVMRQHPSWGFEMLADVQFLEPALEVVYSHHERWDGGGYPRGLRQGAIPLAARVFAVVDTYDSITSDRPYRRARSHPEAVTELCRVSGTQLDPRVVEAFIRLSEVDLRRLRERSGQRDLSVRIPGAVTDIRMADRKSQGSV
ncbi:MAG TPA: HD-GYP domain-containing protein [Thermoanaerobaculia bacterium]|nr:HD-GYP domain-containing protein [Thermoanaerobaculia bacterium]